MATFDWLTHQPHPVCAHTKGSPDKKNGAYSYVNVHRIAGSLGPQSSTQLSQQQVSMIRNFCLFGLFLLEFDGRRIIFSLIPNVLLWGGGSVPWTAYISPGPILYQAPPSWSARLHPLCTPFCDGSRAFLSQLVQRHWLTYPDIVWLSCSLSAHVLICPNACMQFHLIIFRLIVSHLEFI